MHTYIHIINTRIDTWRRVRTSIQAKTFHIHWHHKRNVKREKGRRCGKQWWGGKRDEGAGYQVRCHAGCKRGMNGVRPLSQPFPSLACVPFQMASRRTSFPRLTASRYAEGNENNEIQRSSVTYARRAPSLNSHLYYLSGSKSIQPSHPPVLIRYHRFCPGVDGVSVAFYGARPLPTCFHLEREPSYLGGGNLYPQWNCAAYECSY